MKKNSETNVKFCGSMWLEHLLKNKRGLEKKEKSKQAPSSVSIFWIQAIQKYSLLWEYTPVPSQYLCVSKKQTH